ncbi:hypothetical protein Tco_0059557 [Tanacetum coccineum]
MMEDFMKRINQQREQEALLVAQREKELPEQEQAAQEKEEFSPKPVFRQIIEEMCGTKVCEEQKQNMKDTMLDLLEDCLQKELYCIHNNEKQEVKNIVEQATKRRTRIIEYLQNFKVTSKDSFGEVLKFKKSNHFSIGSSTLFSDSRPSLTSFETSDYLLEEFTDELALLDPFPPGNEDFDFEADLREIEFLLNRDPSTDFSPTIMIDPNPERFINEPDLVCLPLPGDDDDDK